MAAPQRIGDIVAHLMARTGFADVQAAAAMEAAWREAAGETVSRFTRLGPLRRGRLEIIVANSALMQELGFQKAALMKALSARIPDGRIKDLRFRLGAVN